MRPSPVSVALMPFLLVAAGCSGDGASGEAGGLAAFPAPPPDPVPVTRFEDFVGAEACAGCHAEPYAAWVGSTHGRAGGPARADVVIAPFDGRPIRFADAVVVPRVAGNSYEFVVRQDGFEEATFTVGGVIGGGHMIGGGTQGFLTRLDDGTERFLPWDWSRTNGLWFCNTGSRTNQGWVPITPRMRLAECGDWPPLRPIGTVDRFANCQECHGSQILTTLDVEAQAYHTRYTTLQVNCESCHGPGRKHVEWASAGASPAEDPGLFSLAYLGKDASLTVCFQCHALKDVLHEGYRPGEALEAYYALKFPVLGDEPYFADGRVRSFAYQANHLASACYLQGPMDCVSCHEPHGQGYWDTDRRPLASPFDDGQCTSCHPSKLEPIEAHTYHPAESEGSRCVSCHMPYLQHPEVGSGVRFARSDHTIAVPRPVFDGDLGLTGACVQCHDDRSTLGLEGQVRAWWGEPKPHRPLIQGQVDELRARNASEAAGLLLLPGEVDPLIQFQALSRLLTGYLQPNDSTLADDAVDGMRELAGAPDLDVRALALAALHWTRGEDPTVRRVLVEALGSDSGPLRDRWVLALGFMGDRSRDRDQPERAAEAYRKALELRPGDPRILQARGLLETRTGDFDAAVASLRASLQGNANRPLGWVNLGIALANSGDVAGAGEAYQRALDLNPREAVAHFNLGNLRQRASDLPGAAEAYRRAVESDPGLGRAHFELARVLIRLERPVEALPHARRAVEFLPDHAPSRQMLQDLERVVSG